VVGRAGETIKTLAQTLGQTGEAASQIVASAAQQATGLTQVNEAMHNVEQVSHKNVSAIRQIEQAAQHLNSLSLVLRGLTEEQPEPGSDGAAPPDSPSRDRQGAGALNLKRDH
ncbi:MAG: methyl-accepting chemotaxis protein, partial [Planctomycetes bacterium]|nr:methyl-accepting chemotaxis protein [Planctomycetota bacterium]